MTNEKAIEAVARIVSRVMGRDNYALAMQTAHEIVYLLNYEAAKPVAEALVGRGNTWEEAVSNAVASGKPAPRMFASKDGG